MADASTPVTLEKATTASYHFIWVTVLASANFIPMLAAVPLWLIRLGASYKLTGYVLAVGAAIQTVSVFGWARIGPKIGFDYVRCYLFLFNSVFGIGLIVSDLTTVIVCYFLVSPFLHVAWIWHSYLMNIMNQSVAVSFFGTEFSLKYFGVAAVLLLDGVLASAYGPQSLLIACLIFSLIGFFHTYFFILGSQQRIRKEADAERLQLTEGTDDTIPLLHDEEEPKLQEVSEGISTSSEIDVEIDRTIKWRDLPLFLQVNLFATGIGMGLTHSQYFFLINFFVVFSKETMQVDSTIAFAQLAVTILFSVAAMVFLTWFLVWKRLEEMVSHRTQFVLIPLIILSIGSIADILLLFAVGQMGISNMSKDAKITGITICMALIGVMTGVFNVTPSSVLTEYTPPNCDYVALMNSHRVFWGRLALVFGEILIGYFMKGEPRMLCFIVIGVVLLQSGCLVIMWVHYLSGQHSDFHEKALRLMSEKKTEKKR